jgi:hypothetical protein
MHLQIRCRPIASPPDVEKALDRLAKQGVNLVAIGGSDVEFGGELAVVPEDGQEDQALEALRPYNPRVLHVDDPESGLTLCLVENRPGALHDCLSKTSAANLERGRIIRDILIGIPDKEEQAAGQVPVHIYSEQVRTPQTIGNGGTMQAGSGRAGGSNLPL